MAASKQFRTADNRRRRGFIVPTAVAMIFVLLGFVGLAFDVGYMQWMRRRAQTAADAAALAGAWAAVQGDTVTTTARNASAENGFTNGSNGITVTINNPPSSGSYSGVTGAIEAIVSQDAPSYFMRFMGFNTLPVRARAVAQQGYSTACIYALDPTAKAALKIAGGPTLNLGCGAVSESTDPDSIDISGNSSVTMTNGASLGAVGNYTACSGCVNPSYAISGGVANPGDPLATLAMPTYSTQPCFNTSTWSMITGTLCSEGAVGLSPGTYQPGVYCGGITVNSGVSATFSPGLYILAGGVGLTVNSGTVTGTGVSFYFTDANGWPCTGVTGNAVNPGSVTISSQAVANLSAPTDGAQAGILFFGNRNDTSKLSNNNINGGSNFTIDGAIYFPNSSVSFSGASDSSGYLILVADQINFSGGSTFSLNNLPSAFASNNPAFKQWVSIAE